MIDIKRSTTKLLLVQGILCENYQEQFFKDLELCRDMTVERSVLTNGLQHPLLIDIRKVRYLSFEVREYLLCDVARGNCNAIAILADDVFSKLQRDTLLVFHNKIDGIPVKTFSRLDKAVRWLQCYLV
ncbi:MAG: hypothetical protein WBA74_17495 [Cyclobacteriaceae bacterium]